MGTVKCYLDSFPLTNLTSFEWQITEGTSPYQTSFPLLRSEAFALLNRQKQLMSNKTDPFLELKMEDPFGTSLRFQNVFVLPPSPHPNPRFITINITDSRYFLNRVHLTHAFNVKSFLGDRKVIRDFAVPGGLSTDLPNQVIDTYRYKTFSLNPPNAPLAPLTPPPSSGSSAPSESTPRPWKLSEIIIFILEYYNATPNMPRLKISEDAALRQFDNVVIEDIWIDQDIRSALNTVLGYTSGLGMFVDNTNTVRFFDRTTGEENLLQSTGTAHENSEFYLAVPGDLDCPSYIEVLFTKDMEVRFDFIEAERPTSSGESTSEADGLATEQRVMFNVMECPDPILTLANGDEAYSGQWLRFDEAIPAFKTTDFPTTGGGSVKGVSPSFKDIQEFWPLEGAWMAVYAGVREVEPRVLWNNRLAAIKKHYRQSYKISQRWFDKMVNIRPTRVAIVDNATGTYAPASVYQNYAFQTSVRGFIAAGAMSDITKWQYWFNDEGFVNFDNLNDPENKVCTAAFLTLADVNQGIINLNFRQDPLQLFTQVFPSTLVNVPTIKMGEKTVAQFQDESRRVAEGEPVLRFGLSPTHRVSVVLTATPSPNIKGDMYSIRVLPKVGEENNGKSVDLGAEFGGLISRINGAIGVPYQIKVDKQYITARFAWDDGLKAAIEASFGVGDDAANYTDDLRQLLINESQLVAVAKRVAATHWIQTQTRFKGSKETFFQMMYPRGTISRISFRVTSEGKPGTILYMDDRVVSPSFLNLLPHSIRAFLLRQQGT